MVRFGCAQSLIVTFDKERDIETPEGLISVRPAWKGCWKREREKETTIW